MAQSRHAKKKKQRNTLIPLLIFTAFIVVFIIIITLLIKPSSPDSPQEDPKIENGVSIDGIDISGMKESEARKALEERENALLADFGVTLRYEDNEKKLGKEELQAGTNLDDLLKKAEKWTSGEEPLTLKLVYSESALHDAVEAFCDSIGHGAKAPSVSGFDFETRTFTIDPGRSGLIVDENDLLDQAHAILKSGSAGTATARAENVSVEDKQRELENSLGEIAYFSTYCTNNANSEHNMRLAMQKLDRAVVPAGDIISFNEVVGDSTRPDLGWVESGAWVNGRLENQYGGGLCQAATTLYICGLKANMEVEERFCHLRPSSYCDIGLDATIDYDYIDLKMRNTSNYPIYIVSEMNGLWLEMTMYGYISPDYDHIELSSWETGTFDKPDPEYEVDPELKKGEYALDSEGYIGIYASAERSWYDAEGNLIKTEPLPSSRYGAVAPLYHIGKGTDTEKIPKDKKSGNVDEDEASSELSEVSGDENPDGSETSENPENPDVSEDPDVSVNPDDSQPEPDEPSDNPGEEPSEEPSEEPYEEPSEEPYEEPSEEPYEEPSGEPYEDPYEDPEYDPNEITAYQEEGPVG